jgi:DNA-binding NarL/FixJ family response regulator
MGSMNETRLTVALCARHALRDQCLARFLELSGVDVQIMPAEQVTNGGELTVPDLSVDIAVIDTAEHGCGEPDITAIFARLSRTLPGIPIVVVSDREGRAAVLEALRLGARAYVPSNLDPDILFQTLQFVHKGGSFIPLDVLRDVLTQRGAARRATVESHGLTEGELRVLELLRRGQPNKVIARALDIEEGTVKVHVRRILKKLHAANRTEAALVAQQMVHAS